ncbi:uncharacterized protein RJT21DRAFT_118492 [Scheffersomyces amazonensis]|uniref:uncharacterized protein n=1 Tax=Scheffersomyces amazonensis TaxID=1078765 RepID=UPI00315CEB6E
MLSKVVSRNIGIFRGSVFNGVGINPMAVSTRFNSDFTKKLNTKDESKKKSKSSISDINDLLNSSLEHTDSSLFKSKSSQYISMDLVPQPRDTAKKVKILGPSAGRAVDVQHNGLGRAFGQLRRLTFDNRIKHFQRVQERHIRPAKYRKQKKREWWRNKFSDGFKDLMAQVTDARRRGY